MERLSRGFRLAKASWGVVKADKELLWLPIVSMLCSFIIVGLFTAGAFGIGIPQDGQRPSPALYVLLFVMYVALSFVTIYFNSALVAIAMKRLKGEPATLADGFAAARAHLGQIFLWAVVTATVGMILRAIQERGGILGRIVGALGAIAWSVLTFFVVPVLIFEDAKVGDAIKRSGHIFKERWGEQFAGNATIGLATLLVAIPILIISGLLFAVSPVVGIIVGILAVVALLSVSTALTAVFNTALYRFATTGDASGAFTPDDLAGAFKPKKGPAPTAAQLGWAAPPAPPMSQGGEPPARPDHPTNGWA
ncbi:MAG: hypothetical protein QOE25_1075 [Actinomycetota bacterium]|nr:hypothetical protein [Actinomycetota bacterium]